MRYSDPLDMITNILGLGTFFVVCHFTMQRRYRLWITIVAEAALFCAHMLIGSLLPFRSVWQQIYVPLLWISILCLLYREKWYRVAFIFLLCYLALIVSELIGVNLFYTPEILAGDMRAGSFSQRVMIRLQALLLIYLFEWIVLLFLRRRTDNLIRSQYLPLIVFPFTVTMFFNFMASVILQNPEINRGYWLFTLAAVMGSMILMFILTKRSSRQTVIEAENNLLSRQLEMQLKHYEGLSAQYEDVRAMRHDIAKHMNTVQSLLEEGRNEEASAYFDQIQEDLPDRGYGICEHPIVDAFLHYFLRTAEDAGVRVETAVSVPYRISISPHDLICIFGNLLDNALEACKGASDSFIRIRSVPANGYFLVSMENSVSGDSTAGKKGTRIPQLPRGVGFTILQQIAEKYNGHFSVSQDGELFRSELSLKTEE